MVAGMTDVPHLAFPMRLADDGTLADREQGELPDVEQAVHLIARTRPGDRPLAPRVGIDDPTFADFDPAEMQAALEDAEPLADVEVVTDGPDARGRQRVDVRVSVRDDDQATSERPNP